MEILAVLNKNDGDMVELYSHDKKWLLSTMHIDCFDALYQEGFHQQLSEGNEVVLTLTIKEEIF